jgi:acyl dehydratase
MKDPFPKPRAFHYDQINEGMVETNDYVISPEVYEHFLAAFHDFSPIHVDEELAKSRGFQGKVMHGALLNGFVSHFVGMHFPGETSLLLACDLRFSNPSYLGDSIRMTVEVSQKMDAHRIVVLNATLTNITRNHLAARGRIQVKIAEDI